MIRDTKTAIGSSIRIVSTTTTAAVGEALQISRRCPLLPMKQMMMQLYTVVLVIVTTTTTVDDVTAESTTAGTHLKINHILNQLQTWQRTNSMIHQQKELPFVTVAFAQSMDGYMAPYVDNNNTTNKTDDDDIGVSRKTESNYPLSGNESLLLTHALRSIHDGIMIGGRTLLIDNPRLSNRLWGSHHITGISSVPLQYQQPQPIIIDPHLRYLKQLLQLSSDQRKRNTTIINARHPIICCSYNASYSMLLQQYDNLVVSSSQKIVTTTTIDNNNNNNSFTNSIRLLPCQWNAENGTTTTTLNMTDVLHQLYIHYNIRSVMVEGGANTVSKLFTACNNVVDAIIITIAPQILYDGIRPIFGTDKKDGTKNSSVTCPIQMLVPSTTSFVLLGNDATLIAQCKKEKR